MEKKPYVATKIDKQNLNARWYASFDEAEAIQRLILDGLAPDEDWARTAYHKMVADVEKFDHELWLADQVENKKIELVKKPNP